MTSGGHDDHIRRRARGINTQRALPAVCVCCFVFASADTLLEFSDSRCLQASSSSELPTAADWRNAGCVAASRRESHATASGEVVPSGKVWKTSFSMECQKTHSATNSVNMKMFGASSNCRGSFQEAYLSSVDVDKLFAGKCATFKPKLLGAPEMYLRLQDFGSAQGPCADDGQAVAAPSSYGTLSISADIVAITTQPPSSSPAQEEPAPSLRSKHISKQRLQQPSTAPELVLQLEATTRSPHPTSPPPPSRTTLLVAAKKGATTLVVTTTMGFAVGDVIVIDGREHHQIVGFSSIIIDTPLLHAYPSDIEITRLPLAQAANYVAVFSTEAPPTTEAVAPLTEMPGTVTAVAPLSAATVAPSHPLSDNQQTVGMLSASADTMVQQARINMINGIDPISSDNQAAHEDGSLTRPTLKAKQNRTDLGDSKLPPSLNGKLPCAALSSLNDGPSPILVYTRELHTWLKTSDQQVAIAGTAAIVGLFTACDGFRFWHLLFTLLVTAAGAAIVHYEVEALPLSSNAFAHEVLVAEAAVVIAFAMHVGFEGSQVLLGVLLGFWCAYEMAHIADELDTYHEGLAIIWYTGGAFLGCLVFAAWRRAVLGVLAPLLGGLLCASAIGLLASRGIQQLMMTQKKSDPLEIELAKLFPGPKQAWVDAMTILLGKRPSAMIALQCVFALVGALLHYAMVAWVWRYPRAPGVVMVVLGILMSLFTGLSNFGCHPLTGPQCPEGQPWRWLLAGSLVWAAIAGLCTYRQMESVEHNMSFRLPNYMKLDSHSEREFDPHRLAGLTAAPDVPMDNHRTVTATIVHPNLRPGEEPDPAQRERLLGLRPPLSQESEPMGVSLAKSAQGDRNPTGASTNVTGTSFSVSRH